MMAMAPEAHGERGTVADVPSPFLSGVRSLVLAEGKLGRILLHVVCAFRTRQIVWHWQGIRRELHA